LIYIKKAIIALIKPLGILRVYHFLLAWASNILYRHPSGKLVVIGVTGTKGKSTVVELLNTIFKEAGEKVVLSSSIRFQVGGNSWANSTGNTMPGRGYIQKLLRDGVSAGCKYGIIEVVSEGTIQNRHKFIDFDAAIFTGLHPEHIESHGSLEKYRDAKLKFFRDVKKYSKKGNKKFVINKNNEHSKYFIDVAGNEEVVLYDRYNGALKLVGDFNKENAAAAAAVARSLGISDEVIGRALRAFTGVPGRMEFVKREPFSVVVDYAHTPDSLEAVYKTLKPEGEKKLICVLGSAGGGRDKWKRPKLGEIASRYCDEIILTDEDPFDEDPRVILLDIEAGISNSSIRVREVLDRREAIRHAINLAGNGDVVVITGKGSEPYIRVSGGRRINWSDVGAVNESLAEKAL